MLKDLCPIIITSPIQRSGTTLLQRLLSSAPNTLIFGETCAHDLNMLLGLVVQKRRMYGREEKWRVEQLSQVLVGEVNDWIPDLMPDTAEYLVKFEESVAHFLQFFAEFARRNGREQWGIKLPGWNVFQLEEVLHMIPRARIVYIHRGLAACVRSAKLVQICEDLPATQQFAQFWQMNLSQAKQRLKRKEVLWIDYDELVANPASIIAGLEQFTDARPIDIQVMEHRINNYGQSLIPLIELSSEEQELISAIENTVK